MGSLTMIECDNPKCQNVGHPEWEPPPRSKKPMSAPYGWYQGDVLRMGPGPHILFYACSEECIGPAAVEKFEEDRRREREMYE
jgi:hypothetical protein